MRHHLPALLTLLALAAAACTADDPQGEQEAELAKALEYSECMRDNGIADFPDPEEHEGGGGLQLPEGIDPESDAFEAAAEACEQYMPGPAAEDMVDADAYAALLDYAECMREAGIDQFPDPEEDGLNVRFDELGIDPDSDDYQAALDACEDERPDDGALHDGA
ncbi:hypothetical protein [Glycomyces sp. NPDC048151]|uniref:hypothetical protein n=1 Tax=Glycomyces sp. NPDC048151 TaxID=3364002 RepID=UPI003724674F